MSVRDIEFIRTNDLNVKEADVLKLEISDDEDLILDAAHLRNNNTQYGEVFMVGPGRLLLICSLCDEVHASMQQFGEHIRGKHLDSDIEGEDDVLQVKIEEGEFEPKANVQGPPAFEEVLESADENELESSHGDAGLDQDAESTNGSCESDQATESDSDNEPLTEKVKRARKLMNARKPEPTKITVSATKSDLFCRKCNRGYSTLRYFNVHIKKHEDKKGQSRWLCHYCNKEFSTEEQLGEHKSTHNRRRPFQCPQCPRSFSSRGQRQRHIDMHLMQESKRWQCHYCNKEFSTKEQLGIHKNTHNRRRPFQCPQCPKSFSSRGLRKLHIDMHLGNQPHKCPECPKAFRVNTAWRHHMLTKHGVLTPGPNGVANLFSCEICGRQFLHQAKMNVHMRWHTGESPFQCELCGRKFRHGGLLNDHMKRHNNERNYECKVCGKSFYSNRMLNEHQVVHSTEKPFECGDCGKRFSRRLTLKLHQKIHSDVYQYSCNICGKQFKQSSGLYSHKKTHGIGKSD